MLFLAKDFIYGKNAFFMFAYSAIGIHGIVVFVKKDIIFLNLF